MRLPNTYMDNGFTLIEILLVISLMSFIAGLGSIVGLDNYQKNRFDGETYKIISLIQRARANALNNKNGNSWGIRIDAKKIILFEGNTYNQLPLTHENYSFSAINHAGLPIDIIFYPLNASIQQPANFELKQYQFQKTISINQEGQITW